LKLLTVAAGLAISLATVAPAAAAGPLDLQSLGFNAPITMRAGQRNLFSAFYHHTGTGEVPANTVFSVEIPKGFGVDTSGIKFTASTANGLIDMSSGCSFDSVHRTVICPTTQVIPGRPAGDTLGDQLSITVVVQAPGSPGDFVASYAADTTGRVVETNEKNNVATRTIHVI
jgi:hypothetical protein